jgi:hypothetical protein
MNICTHPPLILINHYIQTKTAGVAAFSIFCKLTLPMFFNQKRPPLFSNISQGQIVLEKFKHPVENSSSARGIAPLELFTYSFLVQVLA